MKKFFGILWGLLRNNLVLKIMALLFAIILWSYVLSETNPLRERNIPDIPVGYKNAEDLEEQNLAISQSLSDALETVDIRIEVNQNELKYLITDNYEAYIDLSTISGTGYHTIKIEADPAHGEVLSINPSEITIYVDYNVTNTVEVSVETIGSVPDDYWADTPEITPNGIDISGAKIDVETVASAVCTIDLTGLTETYSKSMSVTLLDSDGEVVDENLFADSLHTVIVKQEILARKDVEIDLESSIFGQDNLAAGYVIEDITCDPETVTIVGEKSVLDTISAISLVSYSVSGASEDKTVLLDYNPPDGVIVLSDRQVEVKISIREETTTEDYHDIEILQKNLSSGLKATLDIETVDVYVLATISKISSLDESMIVPYVDLENLEAGQHTLEVKFELPEGFTEDNFSSSVSTVIVTIEED